MEEFGILAAQVSAAMQAVEHSYLATDDNHIDPQHRRGGGIAAAVARRRGGAARKLYSASRDHETLEFMVERKGIEPSTFALRMRTRRADLEPQNASKIVTD
jgi:hypothetical protein